MAGFNVRKINTNTQLVKNIYSSFFQGKEKMKKIKLPSMDLKNYVF